MTEIVWDKTGERLYETGLDHGVLYLPKSGGTYGGGVPWNGLTSVNESPSGAEPTPIYADNIKYLNLISVEELGGTIEAYMYPEEFAQCNGEAELADGVSLGQQPRKTFGLSYRTRIGNDVNKDEHGYKLHLLYGAQAAPSERAHTTVNESPEAMAMSWTFTTTAVEVTGFKPTALITVDSTKCDPEKLEALEDVLYGRGEATEAILPLPSALVAIVGD